jgi:hypothetical protein
MTTWKKHKRKGGMAPDRTPYVSLRREGIAFNSQFASQARLDEHMRVTIFVDSPKFRIGLKFHSNASDDDSYALCRDGGGRGRGRMAQTQALIRDFPWIGAVARAKENAVRRFQPQWNSADGLWIVEMCPSFEVKVSHKSEIPSDLRGIYRYWRGDEVVYIGRGVIRSRASSPERTTWDFDIIEYSVVADDASQVKWEAYWLDIHVAEHNGLPFYNRIGGKKVSKNK